MCSKVKGKIRLLASYFGILVIGILIYLMVLIAIDKRHKKSANTPLANESNSEEFIDDLGIDVSVSSANLMNPSAIANEAIDNVANISESGLDITDRHSLNELPNEIDNAMNAIETPNIASESSGAMGIVSESSGVAFESSDKSKSFALESDGESKSVATETFPKNFVVNTKILRIRAEPSTDSAVIKHFKNGAIIRVSKIEGKWAQLENGGWAYLSLLRESK